ncbi:MAG: hypothetical protein ACF788_05780 [Novipirellula sp. JB048]
MKFSIETLQKAPHKKQGKRNGTEHLVEATARDFGGYPHPEFAEFAEWLMGFPPHWTQLECMQLETQSARSWQGGLGDACESDTN